MKRMLPLLLIAGLFLACFASAQAAEDGAKLLVTAASGKHILPAGQTLQLTAALTDEQKTNETRRVFWQVKNADGTPADPKLIQVSDTGLVTADRAVKQGMDVVITATDEERDLTAEYALLVYPPVKRITIKPAKPMAFVGGKPLVVNAVTEPAGLGKTLVWKVGKPEVARLKRNADGSISIYPGAEGTTVLTAKADSGVTARVTLTVISPVTGVEILGGDYVRKGEGIVLSAKLSPRLLKERGVVWSLDVDPSIATVNAQGRVKPTADCPVGTVITVTCRPVGTDDPNVFATKEIVVTYPRPRN
ncbi:MAG: hypothetical protein IJ662_11925 [Clostridia bacterium]|nr:hypothetical protein [Clostridia bacterium]